jgi:hypothetical protein
MRRENPNIGQLIIIIFAVFSVHLSAQPVKSCFKFVDSFSRSEVHDVTVKVLYSNGTIETAEPLRGCFNFDLDFVLEIVISHKDYEEVRLVAAEIRSKATIILIPEVRIIGEAKIRRKNKYNELSIGNRNSLQYSNFGLNSNLSLFSFVNLTTMPSNFFLKSAHFYVGENTFDSGFRISILLYKVPDNFINPGQQFDSMCLGQFELLIFDSFWIDSSYYWPWAKFSNSSGTLEPGIYLIQLLANSDSIPERSRIGLVEHGKCAYSKNSICIQMNGRGSKYFPRTIIEYRNYVPPGRWGKHKNQLEFGQAMSPRLVIHLAIPKKSRRKL